MDLWGPASSNGSKQSRLSRGLPHATICLCYQRRAADQLLISPTGQQCPGHTRLKPHLAWAAWFTPVCTHPIPRTLPKGQRTIAPAQICDWRRGRRQMTPGQCCGGGGGAWGTFFHPACSESGIDQLLFHCIGEDQNLTKLQYFSVSALLLKLTLMPTVILFKTGLVTGRILMLQALCPVASCP